MPCISALHRRKCSIPIVRIGSVRRIGPGNDIREIANDLPMWKQGAVSVGRLQALMDAKRDAEFEAEISLLEDHNADIPEPIFSAQITQLFRWRNQGDSAH